MLEKLTKNKKYGYSFKNSKKFINSIEYKKDSLQLLHSKAIRNLYTHHYPLHKINQLYYFILKLITQ